MLPGSEPDLARAAERVVLVIAQVLAQVGSKGRPECRAGAHRDRRDERWEWLRAQDVMRSVRWLVPPARA